ncbi:MAG: CHAT domain-containing protein [Blastocatellia bacterium]|nr:CHAT domain-containing protein [Blastocatellia bacterium]
MLFSSGNLRLTCLLLGFQLVLAGLPVAGRPLPQVVRSPRFLFQNALEPGKPVERELAGGASHTFALPLETNQYVALVVEQKGIDVVVVVSNPAGKQLCEMDSPNGTSGPEPLFFVTETAGTYRLEIRSLEKTAPVGRYEAKIVEIRRATTADAPRLTARQLLTEGQTLKAQRTGASLKKAWEKLEAAVPLWRAAGDRKEEAQTFNQLGEVCYYLGETQKSLEYYGQAIPIFRELGAKRELAETIANQGPSYSRLDNQQKAIECYQLALPLQREIGDRAGEATSLSNLGAAFAELGENQKALEYYAQALPLRREVKDRAGEANTLNNIATIYAATDKVKAIEYFTLALALSRTMKDQRREGNLLHNLGILYSQNGEREKGLELLLQALPLRRAAGDRAGEAFTLSNLGAAYGTAGDLSKAMEYYEQGLALRRAVGDRGGEANVLFKMAQVERKRNNLAVARERVESAIAIIEDVRATYTNQQLRTTYFSFFKGEYDYFQFYIDVLMQMHRANPTAGHDAQAFQVSESAKARNLLNLLLESGTDIRQGVDPKLLEQELTLRQQLSQKSQALTLLLSRNHTAEQVAVAHKDIADLTAAGESAAAQIRAQSPRYATLAQPQPLTVKDMQQRILDPETALLEYALGDERSYLWVVTAQSVKSYELPSRKEIEKTARRVYEQVTARVTAARSLKLSEQKSLATKSDAAFAAAATELSRMILAPAAAELTAKRLLVVADGALQYVPFAALPVPSAPGPSPLIVDHEITILPSASALVFLRQETGSRKPALKTVAVLADPVFEVDDARFKATVPTAAGSNATRSRDRYRKLGLAKGVQMLNAGVATETEPDAYIPRLAATEREGSAILSLVPPTKRKGAFGFQASRSAALSPDLSQYQIIHFATHGMVNTEQPELSGLVLSLFDAQGQEQNGFLLMPDLFSLRLPAELVVLSACQTGLGKEVKGEGLVGLTQGFMFAGTKRVMVSLWNVSDRATSELMIRMYRHLLREKLAPAAALRAAQLEMLKNRQWQSPFYWAAFQVQGEWQGF